MLISALVCILALHVFPGESSAFWWLFKKKSEEQPAMPPASYSIGSDDYYPDYGDAVRVAVSKSEFVICETCPKQTALERELKPISLVLRMTTTELPAAVLPVPEIPSPPAESSPVPESESPRGEEGSSPKNIASIDKTPDEQQADKQSNSREFMVYFDLGSSRVREEDRIRLEDFSKSLTGKESILVKGFTCDIGGKSFNDRLAMDRARAVAGIIEKNGTKPVMVMGEGKCCYVSEDKALNRRVEIRCDAIN
jgi:outer membrane protein OmpA-like peptidoglycan-associated protein